MPLFATRDYSPSNPPPDDADVLALTAYDPFTRVYSASGGFNFSDSAGATRVLSTDARLTYRGASEIAVGASYPDTECSAAGSIYPHGYNAQFNVAVDFFTDAQWFEFQTKFINTGQAYRLLVDGRRTTDYMITNPSITAVGNPLNFRFDFPSPANRRITLEFYCEPLDGIFIPSTASVWKVPAYQDRTLVMGDSITAGAGPNIGGGTGTWLHRAALLLGWQDPWNQSVGGTGYTVAGSYVDFEARATGVVSGAAGGLNDIGQYGLATGVTRVIFFGGYNDAVTGASQASIQTAANNTFANVKAALPGAQFYVIGVFSPINTPTTAMTNTDNTLQAAALAAGLPFISPLTGRVYNGRGTLLLDQGQWITTANMGAYISTVDNTHPTDAGHAYLAERIASSIQAIINAASSIEPWAGGVHAALDDGQPSSDKEWNFINGPGTLATMTPTALSITVARCWSYNCQFPLVVNRLRWWGIGATTSHRFAVYRASDGVQVIGPISLTTTADAWNSASIAAVTLAQNTAYICAISTTTTGTTAGLRTSATPLLWPPLQASTPGGLALAVGDHRFWFGQFTVSAGVLPGTLPTLVRGSGWTAGLPLFFFDSNSAA
jgi:GDSL-like Lipase/Acylhydrolase family